MSPYQGPPISVDDADNIRRFIEQMGRSGTAKPTNVPVDDPPTILPTNHEDTTDTDRDMPEMSTNSSPPAAPERDTVQAYDMQSPQARGVLAPPPTPNMPLGNEDIGRMIHDQINALPSTFTLGDSKYAPKKSSLLTGARPPGVHISSSPKMPQVSTEQRRDHNLSFARMSFITSDDPPLRFPILLSKENSDKVPGIKTSESKYDSPPAVDFKAASGSSEFKDKSPSEHTTLAMPQDSEKPVSSEEGMRASAYTPPTTPPHLQAAKEPDYPVPSFPDLKIKDEPIEKPMVVLKENKLPDTHAKLASDNSMFRDMAKSQADKTVPLRREYSPSRGTLATRTAKEDETLKNALYFTSWPQSQRDKPVSRARKVVLVGLPPASSPVFVTSLIHGGPIEQVALVGPTTAFVLFLNADDAAKFYKKTGNGIECQKDGIKYLVLTEMNVIDVDVVGGKLRQWIDSGMTRCVRAIGVDDEWTLARLYGFAEAKNRKVEVIEVGENQSGLRSVVFRFCKIDHAVEFKASISRSDDWEQCNIHFAPDPCAEASKASAT